MKLSNHSESIHCSISVLKEGVKKLQIIQRKDWKLWSYMPSIIKSKLIVNTSSYHTNFVTFFVWLHAENVSEFVKCYAHRKNKQERCRIQAAWGCQSQALGNGHVVSKTHVHVRAIKAPASLIRGRRNANRGLYTVTALESSWFSLFLLVILLLQCFT